MNFDTFRRTCNKILCLHEKQLVFINIHYYVIIAPCFLLYVMDTCDYTHLSEESYKLVIARVENHPVAKKSPCYFVMLQHPQKRKMMF